MGSDLDVIIDFDDNHFYQLPLILTALSHVDLINVTFLYQGPELQCHLKVKEDLS